uniref:Cation/H+ exchanger transmembrane domain-containing protein n=1 Tax=Labrus bergylta TaxID=56723 RepID=A0A3Q3GXC9_9LABR
MTFTVLSGVLVGLTVRYSSSASGHGVVGTDAVCSCDGFNSTPHFLTVNITSHVHCFRHAGKLDQSCPLVPAPQMVTFDPEVLFNLFLPPIIFHGAYSLNQRRVTQNLGSIVTFAFVGTIISCVTIGACVFGFTRLMVLFGRAADADFLLADCLLFGAIMSATDPVSVLCLLSELHVDPDLHTLLFGESVLNDAVAIVLTHAITVYSQAGAGQLFNPLALLLSVGHFLGVLAGSFLLGFMFAVITTPLVETSLFFLLSWSSFLSAEACGLSGIIAVMFCGLSQARYTVHNLSTESKTRTKQLFEVLNILGEISIFSYMGYVLLTFPHHVFKALFIFGAFVSFCFFVCSVIEHLHLLLSIPVGRRKRRCSLLFCHFRGAVAFSLTARDTSTERGRTIFTTTLLLVGFTVWVLGAASDPALRYLNIKSVLDTFKEEKDKKVQRYLKPLLTHYGPSLSDSLPQCCGVGARLFRSPNIQEDEEQLCETEPDDCVCDLEETERQVGSIGGDNSSEHQEDLLEGDLGLGTAAAPSRES